MTKKENKGNDPQTEAMQESQEELEISPIEIEVRKACAVFFATLQNISYVYGLNPKKTEELAEKWIEAVNKEE